MIIFNSINTNSAGTSNVTKVLLNESFDDSNLFIVEDNKFFSSSDKRLTLIKYHLGNGFFRWLNKLKFEMYTLPKMVRQGEVTSVVVMANYNLFSFSCKKAVIMRHPYLVDKESWKEINSIGRYLTELLRKFAFGITLSTTDILIVQTQAMLEMFKESYPNFKGSVDVLANPVSAGVIELGTKKFEGRRRVLLYPSRYYSHKNHEMIIDFVKENKVFLANKGFKFVITLDKNGDGAHILNDIKEYELDDYIVNIGEVEQEVLFDYYTESLCLFFPSNAETFGNSIVESFFSGLPVVINDKPYARTLCKNNAIYFNDLDSIKAAIEYCDENYNEFSNRSLKASQDIPSVPEWFASINKILDGDLN